MRRSEAPYRRRPLSAPAAAASSCPVLPRPAPSWLSPSSSSSSSSSGGPQGAMAELGPPLLSLLPLVLLLLVATPLCLPADGADAKDPPPANGSGGASAGGAGVAGVASTPSQPPTTPKQTAWNETWTDKLKRHLLQNYDKFARPAQYTNTTVVFIDMTIRHVDLDELKSMMTVHGWVKMHWIDEKLKWTSSEWGGLEVLHTADHEIWQPDIMLYNSAMGNAIDHYGNTHCLVYPNGDVLWVPPSQFVVFCALDLRRWPFDEQTCYLRLGSWTYDGQQVELQLGENGAEIELLVKNSEWEIVGVTEQRNVKTYDCCEEPYIDVTYNITIRRRSPTYSALVLAPASVIVLMTLAVFWLPPTAGEKLILSCTTALIVCLFLLYFSQQLPAMAGNTPLIVLFYSSSLYLVCISMLVAVLVLHLARSPHPTPVPWPLRAALLGWPGRILGLCACRPHSHNQGGLLGAAAEELREHAGASEGAFEEEGGGGGCGPGAGTASGAGAAHRAAANARDWMLLATAVDRVVFLLYCFVFAVLALMYAA